MSKKENGIYVTCGEKPMLIGYKVKIEGVLSLAYMKNDKVVGYAPWSEICRQFNEGSCLNL